jgi:transposase
LGKIIKTICGEEVSERIFVLTCCRLLQPESEHGLSYFLKDYYVFNNKGKRWEPEFKVDFAERLKNSNGKDRVKVEWKKLQKWYRTLDKLIKNKERIEQQIYKNVKNLYSLKVDIVFYDITSTYFEGGGPKDLEKFGFSRDDKKNNKQILLGIVLANGLPIAHYVFPGNTADKKTLEFVIKNLEEKFELKNIIVVADKGINTNDNVKMLEELGYKYILGVSLRNCKLAKKILFDTNNLEWKKYNGDTKYAEVELENKKWVLVDSEEKRKYEEEMRKVWMEEGAKELCDLKMRVNKGNLKDEKKIAYYLGSISKKYHIKRYFNWKIKKSKFRFSIAEDKLEKEKLYEGKYLLSTNADSLSPQDIIREYKNLWEVESCFRSIKDIIKIRPIFHQTPQRIKAHVFIASLAYLIEKILQRKIRLSGMIITPQDALKFSKEVKVVELEVLERVIKLITQKIEKVTEDVFSLLRINLPRSIKEIKIDKFTYRKNVQKELFY